MEEKRPVDYFLVAGLPKNPEPIEEFSEEVIVKPSHKQDPIINIVVINKTLGELPPKGYKCVEFTPSGFPADLNHGSIRAPEVYICYKRGRDKAPLTDIGVLYDGKERIMTGCEVIYTTPYGRSANVNNSNSNRIFITYRRMDEYAACGTLAVMDICVVLLNKSETAPHAFCLIEKNLNRAMVGSDVYLCYKKSMCKSNVIPYKPAILGRYPLHDYQGMPLPERVPMFCLPLGASLESWSAKACHPLPQFTTFILTMEFGEKVYGASVLFYEEVDQNTLNASQKELLGIDSMIDNSSSPVKPDSPNTTNNVSPSSINNKANSENPTNTTDRNSKTDSPGKSELPVVTTGSAESNRKTVHETKCICVLSRWPFFDTFKRYLSYLYKVSVSGPQDVPIERLISHFIHEVPFPSPQRPRILVQFNGAAISLAQPEDSPLPQSGASFICLLKNLGPENCLTLLTVTLLEQKILIHSLRHAVLTSVAEAVSSMVFPFHWQCPYIPLCPLELSGVLCAPTPFIVGVDSRYFDLFEPPPDIVCVDLDTNAIKLPDDKKGITYKLLPKKPTKIFRATLEKLYEKLCEEASHPGTPIGIGGFEADSIDIDFNHRRNERVTENAIQEAFLRFMACVLKGYDHYLLPITQAPKNDATDLSSLFDVPAFLKTRDKAYQKFFTPLMRTQLFTRFIEERSFVSDKDASLAFFDECTEKVSEYSEEPKLIDLDDASKSERTVFILPPEPTGLPEGVKYNYEQFPVLDTSLFPEQSAPNPLVEALKATPCPNSPMTRRTKQEVRSAQKSAAQQQKSPNQWAKCLLSHCYSLWFIHLPSYVKTVHSKTKALRIAYEVLMKMQAAKLQQPDEVCYRVLLHLCGVYQQPVLAVRILFQMKQHGIQPNAITYGFYNRALLESKWPTSDTNAYLLWTKVKHVIYAIAQFKQGLKSHRSSMYSNSESECDGVSRTSTDSFLEDIVPLQDRVDTVNKSGGNDIVSVESPNCDERVSTGGMSDKGYSSMTLDDSKRASLIISSEDSIDSLQERATVVMKPSAIAMGSNDSGVEMKIKRSNILRKSSGKRSPAIDPIDPKTDAAFQEKIGSIVRKSNGSVGSTSTLRGSTCSSAGLLMTSQASIDESVFGDFSFSHSLKHKRTSSLKDDPTKRRHSNESHVTGQITIKDEEDRRRSDGVQYGTGSSNYVIERVAGKGIIEEVDNTATSTSTHAVDCVQNVDISVNKIEKVQAITKIGCESNKIPKACSSPSHTNQDPVSTKCSATEVIENDECSKASEDATPVLIEHIDLMDFDKTPTKNSADSHGNDVISLIETGMSSSRRRSDSDRLSQCSETSVKSLTSPSHSIRTPVLENDPLGLFSEPKETNGNSLSKESPLRLDKNTLSSKRDKFHIDLGEPFSGTSTPVKGNLHETSERKLSEDLSRRYNRLQINSFSSSNASSPESPIKDWQPLSVSHSETSMPRDESIKDMAKKRSSTLPSGTDPPNIEGNISPGKRGKFVGRSDSFMKSFKSAATGFMSRFNTLKENVTTGSTGLKDSTGSTSSLSKVPTDYHSSSEALNIQQKKKSSSLDMLGIATEDDEDLIRDMDPEEIGQGARLKSARGYTPFVKNLMGDLAHKTVSVSSSAMKSMHQGLVSMKDSVMDSFSENWGIEDMDDSEDEYYETAGYNSNRSTLTGNHRNLDYSSHESLRKTVSRDSEEDRLSNSSSSRKGSAPPHSVLDNYIPVQEDHADKGSDKGSVKHQGSVQSLPQLFFNCAMEVEMCSLSRCNSCNGLLYDEEIMAGWSADDSNLNTSCQFCNSKLVPQLQIYVKDFRQFTEPMVTKASQSMESMHSIRSMPTCRVATTTGNSNLLTTKPNHSVSSLSSADNVLLSNSYNNNIGLHHPTSNHQCQHFHVQYPQYGLHGSNSSHQSTVSNKETVNKTNSKNEETLFENSFDVPDISAVPKLANFNRSSAVKLMTEETSGHSKVEVKSESSLSDVKTVAVKSSESNAQQSDSDNHVGNASYVNGNIKDGLISFSKSDSVDTLDEVEGNESLQSPGAVTDSGETDSIGDVLDDELPENRDLKEPRCKSVTLEPISVPYLSPLVLRKEVENVIVQEGDECLFEDKFVDEHPIIYWNLLWFFKRTDIPSHLPGFMLTAKTTNKEPPPKIWAKADSRHVQIRPVWDNLRIQQLEIGKPMYVGYGQTSPPSSTVNALVTEAEIFIKGTLQHIVSSIMCNDVNKPINMVMNDRRKNKHLAAKGKFRSMYRDLLFLSFVALGRDNIDHDAFDREFKLAYACLSPREIARLRRSDGPPKPSTIQCRRAFGDLEL